VIDDNPEDVAFLTALIERDGFEVTPAADGDTGAALIVSQKWAFAVVDLLLPGKDGVEVIQLGRKAYPDLPIIVISGSSNASLIDAAFRAGANYHLDKPVDPQELLNQIKSYGVDAEPGVAGERAPAMAAPKPTEAEPPPTVGEHTPTIVAVGASPGDVEMGCGGVLCKHRSEGHRIIILNLAGEGDLQSPMIASANLAADLLEAQMENVGAQSPSLVDTAGATSTLWRVLEVSAPGILYLPSASSGRATSVELHRLGLEAAAEAVPNILAYQDPWATVDFRPRFFVDLDPYIKRKLELVGLYDKLGLKNVGTDLAKATALFWGRFAEPTLVEPLEVVRHGKRIDPV
jgi:CheY-like chemotaxis protein